jgi:REP element-mobilizing transposase RayT
MLDDYGFEIYENNAFPQAYLITIRTYGTWLHGDRRFSVSRNENNIYGAPAIAPNEGLEKWMIEEMKQTPRLLNSEERQVVQDSIEELCARKTYRLLAANVRTNHARVVLNAQQKPERIVIEIKANATKFLREAGLAAEMEKIWSRGKSRRYLWKPRNVTAAVNYVLYGQGEKIFVSDEWESYIPFSE